MNESVEIHHAFQKKSTHGIKTPKHEIDFIEAQAALFSSQYLLQSLYPVCFRGSGNIYRDFNIADADVRQLKAILAAEIIKALDRGAISVRKAQSLTGIDAGDFSRVRNADFRRISVERLMTMINGLGSRVNVKVKVRRDETVAHLAMA